MKVYDCMHVLTPVHMCACVSKHLCVCVCVSMCVCSLVSYGVHT